MKNVTYINAGAGSGKTYTLTRLLAEKLSKNEVKPSQVILTTFTKLAADEFKEKAREQILAAYDPKESAGELKPAVNNLEIAAQLESALMGTVHSVAMQIIKKFWYLLDYGAELQTISERDDEFFMSQSLAKIVRERDEGGKLKYQKHLDCFRKFRDYFDIQNDNRPDYLFWQPILREVVDKMEYYEVNDVKESIKRSHDTLEKIYTGPELTDELKKDLLGYMKLYQDHFKADTSEKSVRQSKEIQALLNRCDSFYQFLDLEMVKEPIGPKTIETKCPGYDDFNEKVQGITVSKSHLKILKHFVFCIFELAKAWRDDFKAYKKTNHIISYDDIEQLFLHLIMHEKDVRDYIKDHYRLVMVDEFQDSNPIQLKIFNQLSELIAENDGHSFWVGDPKQSIYGFRGSDTELVNLVSGKFHFYDDKDGAKLHPEEGEYKLGSMRLVESWRSREKLVHLVNDTFIAPFSIKDGIPENLIKLTPHYTEGHKDYKKVDIDPIVHIECVESNADKAVAVLANKVKRLLDSKVKVHHDKLDKEPSEIHPYDVAILCRTNNNAKAVVKALRAVGVPVSEPEDSIMQRIEVQLVVTLLQFVQNPANKHVRADLKRLLDDMKTDAILKDRLDYLSSVKATSEEEGKEGEEHDKEEEKSKKKDEWLDDDRLIKQLAEFTSRLKHLSIPEMVDALIYELDIPALTAKWGDAPIRQQNLSTLRHLATDYDQRCLQLGLGASVNGFIYFLNSTEPDKEKDNHSDTVKVFTYHGAKGLEWSVVILNNLDDNALDDNECIKKSFMRVREMVLGDSDDPFKRTYYLHFFPNTLKGNSSSEKPPKKLVENLAGNPLYGIVKKKVESEVRRLMYVGMTRAKDCLCTFAYGAPKQDGTQSKQQEIEFDWLKNVGVENPTPSNVWGNEDYKLGCFPVPLETTAPSEIDTTWSRIVKPEDHSAFAKRYLSPSKIETFDGYNSHEEWARNKADRMAATDWGKDYARIGSCIHDFFAVYQPGNVDRNRELAQSIINGYQVNLGGSVGEIIKAGDWLYEQLQAKFKQTAEDKVETEVPFQITLGDQTLRGEMDLLWFYTDDNGKHCVLVDYKTFPGVNYNEHTKKHYAQLSAYAHALREFGVDVTHALIYYPVGGVIHELKK